jgi:hypothetical protein
MHNEKKRVRTKNRKKGAKLNQEVFKSFHCERKRPFKSIKSAVNFLKHAKKRGVIVTDSLDIYECQFCGKYHFGHKKGE